MNNNNKSRKSVNLTDTIISIVENYASSSGKSFSYIVESALKQYFSDLNDALKKEVEEIRVEDENNTILIPISLYIQLRKIPFSQLYSEEKKGKLKLLTIQENGKRTSKIKYVCLTEKHPDYHLAKLANLESIVESLSKKVNSHDFLLKDRNAL